MLCIMGNFLFAQQTHLERAQTYLNKKGEVIFTFEVNSKSVLSSIILFYRKKYLLMYHKMTMLLGTVP